MKHYGRWYRHGDPTATERVRDGERTFFENRRVTFGAKHWRRLLERQLEPHPHAAALRAGIEQFRKMLGDRS